MSDFLDYSQIVGLNRGAVKMPDGDVVYYHVGGAFAHAYRELCEGHFSEEHVTASIAKALRKTLKCYGNQPIALVNRVFVDVSQAVIDGIKIQYAEESKIIDESARDLMGHRRGMPLAVDTCKEYVLNISTEATERNQLEDVVGCYVSKVLAADFWERLPLVNHHNNADPEFIEERLRKVRPLVVSEIDHIVHQICKSGNVDRLSKKRRVENISPPDFKNMDVSL
jgi:hypothetical protein